MAKDALRAANDSATSGQDQMLTGTVTGSAAHGYGDFHCDGSSYNKWGNRVDYSKMAATNLK